MNRSKNQIERLIQYKERSKGRKTWNQKVTAYFKMFFEIDTILDDGKKKRLRSKEMASRYFHINNVAFIQEIFKLFVKEMVDSNHEYARRLCQKYPLKIEIDHVSSVLGRRFSLGEFISSQYQPNNLDDLSSFYSTIMEEDFFKAYRSLIESDNGKHHIDLTEGKAIELLKETFEKRHIVAHELNPIGMLSSTDYFRYLGTMLHLYNLFLVQSGQRKGALVPGYGRSKPKQ